MSLGISRLSSLLLLAAYAFAYTWPNPLLDSLDYLRLDGTNLQNSMPSFAGAQSSLNSSDGPNRSNSAGTVVPR